jgi:putative transposase
VKPPRLPSVQREQTYFVTATTFERRFLLQGSIMAGLFIETMFRYRDHNRFLVHAFVVMPNHFHGLLTPCEEVTLERMMQLIKGGFSFRAKHEMDRQYEVWQRGFTDRRVRNRAEYLGVERYIHENPVKARLVREAKEFPYSSLNPEYRLDPLPTYLSG